MRRSLALTGLLLLAVTGGPSVAVARESTEPSGTGTLTIRGVDGTTSLPTVALKVDVRIDGIVATTRIEQSFVNSTARNVEAIYTYPLPDGAAVHAMQLVVGDRRIASEIREKQEARRDYDNAVRGGVRAALVEQRRPNLFTTSAGNVAPGETVVIVLHTLEETRYADGEFELRIPLTFAPRFRPPSPESNANDRDAEQRRPELNVPFVSAGDPAAPRASLSVALRVGFELDRISSPTHAIDRLRDGATTRITLRYGETATDRDFVLRWQPRREERPTASVVVEQRGGERYALLMLLPPLERSEAGLGLPTETLFVVDVSGSMAGPSIRQARAALEAALARLRPEDRFNIVRFNDETRRFRDDFANAGPGEIESAARWVRGLEAGGGTDIRSALLEALSMAGESRSSRAQRVVFLTDGAVDDGQELLRAVAERSGDLRLHTIGIGSATNTYLLRKMASLGRGLCEIVATTDETANRIERFFGRLDRPLMTDLEWSTEGVEFDRLVPGRLPDLHAGEPLYLSARLRGPGVGTVRLRGWTRAGPVEIVAPVGNETTKLGGIAVRWARATIENLMDSLHEGAPPDAIRKEVTALALDHGLVTRYTSLVAVDDRPGTSGPAESARLAVSLPRGGTKRPLRLRLGALLLIAGVIWLRTATGRTS